MKHFKFFFALLLLLSPFLAPSTDRTIILKSGDLVDFVGISSCLMNKKNEFFAFSPHTLKVFKFRADGSFEKSFCNKGEGPGEIRRVLAMFYNPANDCLYLPEFYSQGKGKVSIYDCDGHYKGLMKVNISLRHMDMIQNLCFLKDGSFYAATSERVDWKPEGKWFITQEEVYTRYFKPGGELAAEIHKGRYPGEMSSGKGWGGPGLLFAPRYCIRITDDEGLAVIRNDENMLTVFDKTGKPVKTILIAIEKEILTDEEFTGMRDENLSYFSSRNDPRMTALAKEMVKLKYKPAFSSLFITKKYIVLTKNDVAAPAPQKQKLKFFNHQGRYLGQKLIDGLISRYTDDYIIIFSYSKDEAETFRYEPNTFSF